VGGEFVAGTDRSEGDALGLAVEGVDSEAALVVAGEGTDGLEDRSEALAVGFFIVGLSELDAEERCSRGCRDARRLLVAGRGSRLVAGCWLLVAGTT
jgi:hypothetical protein